MDADILMKIANEIVNHLDAITDPSTTDDASKRAILELAAHVYEVKITREATIAMLGASLDHMRGR